MLAGPKTNGYIFSMPLNIYSTRDLTNLAMVNVVKAVYQEFKTW